MRVAVMAAGAMGGYFGGRLAEAGHEVHFIARGANLAALKTGGLRVKSGLGDLHIARPSATDDPRAVGAVDLVLFTVKLWDVETAGALARPLIGADTRVLSMLNGIDSVERLAPILGADVVAACPTQISAVIEAPGVILHKNNVAQFRCGFLDSRDDARLKAIVGEIRAANVQAEFSRTVEQDLWLKFLFLNALSGATAALRSPLGPIRDDPDTFELLQALIREAEAVGIKKGVALRGFTDKAIAVVGSLPAAMKASMFEDLERGNRIETDWLQGKVVELGKQLGVPTPVNRDIYAVLKLHRMGQPK